MPPREASDRIGEILEAIDKIERYTEGMDLDGFRADERTIDAVLHNLTVIGEAANHVPDEVQTRHPGIPWKRMRGMRNVVVHEYFGVSLEIIWETVWNDLPPLVPRLRTLLEEE